MNLYGTTIFGDDMSDCSFYGMPGCGVVYKVDPSGNETVLHAFTGGADGLAPYGDLLLDESGQLFGATDSGGDTTSAFCSQSVLNLTGLVGCGTVFKVDGDGKFAVLHTFHGPRGAHSAAAGSSMVSPLASVVADPEGNLYGTTFNGGDVTDAPCANGGGCGVVFKLDPRGHDTVLYTFTGGADGANPSANLLLGEDGNLYGTAQDGGDTNCSVPGTPLPGCGVVFKILLHSADQ